MYFAEPCPPCGVAHHHQSFMLLFQLLLSKSRNTVCCRIDLKCVFNYLFILITALHNGCFASGKHISMCTCNLLQVDKILKIIPKERRTYLYSATMTKKVRYFLSFFQEKCHGHNVVNQLPPITYM